MDQNYLELLEAIRDVMAEIKELEEDMRPLLDNPEEYLESLESIRDTLAEIKGLREGVEE